MPKTFWPLMDDIITWGDKLRMVKFILTTNRFTNGPKVRKFEEEWNNWLGSKYSLFVNSGSSANLLLLDAIKEKYNLKNGDKILVPACTWSTNIAPIIHNGFQPVFADIDLHSFSFDVEKLKKVKEIHPDIKIIFVTHLLGLEAELDKYQKIFPEALILEDICEAQGVSNPNGVKYGSNSLGATFSLYFSHHMTSIEGGVICTNDKELYELMRMKRSAGMAREASDENFERYKKENPDISPSFLFPTAGFNLRNHEICAVLGSSQLKRIDHIVHCRRNNYQKLLVLLKKYPDKFYIPKEDPTSSNLCLPFVCKNKETYLNLISKFEEYDIEYRPVVAGNLLKQPFLNGYSIVGDGPFNVDIVHEQGVYIGNSHLIGNNKFKILETILRDI
jgi:CDP-6-deoxy-D-xylo-4-hexulose-3-dehydrase